jgi:hypothetical protein
MDRLLGVSDRAVVLAKQRERDGPERLRTETTLTLLFSTKELFLARI